MSISSRCDLNGNAMVPLALSLCEVKILVLQSDCNSFRPLASETFFSAVPASPRTALPISTRPAANTPDLKVGCGQAPVDDM